MITSKLDTNQSFLMIKRPFVLNKKNIIIDGRNKFILAIYINGKC
jgi:hypothetical protein